MRKKNIKLYIVTDIKVPCLNIICLDVAATKLIENKTKQSNNTLDCDPYRISVPTADSVELTSR